MTVEAEVLDRKPKQAPAAIGIIDCDIHPAPRTPDALLAYVPKRWKEHLVQYGDPMVGPFAAKYGYPRYMPETSRRDAWPPSGGLPGSDVEFMREQHLDKNGIALGVLEPLQFGYTTRNLELGAVLCSAVNDWQVAEFTDKEARLRASIVVPQEDAPAAVAEINRRAGDKSFAQVQMPSLSLEPIGRRRYWPIYEAAVAHNLPIGMHVGGTSASARTASGWPAYYNEEHYSLTHSVQTQITSMVLEGVFEHFPGLRLAVIEGGCAWAPSLSWRLDKLWEKMKGEAPHVKRPPSEYIREHVWFSTQPMEEPESPKDLLVLFEQIGWDKVMFSTDYPHWDFDDPKYAFRIALPEEQKKKILRDNAKAFYALA
jgi:predicted TIM-barrel fold metal-dependent hydrolase